MGLNSDLNLKMYYILSITLIHVSIFRMFIYQKSTCFYKILSNIAKCEVVYLEI